MLLTFYATLLIEAASSVVEVSDPRLECAPAKHQELEITIRSILSREVASIGGDFIETKQRVSASLVDISIRNLITPDHDPEKKALRIALGLMMGVVETWPQAEREAVYLYAIGRTICDIKKRDLGVVVHGRKPTSSELLAVIDMRLGELGSVFVGMPAYFMELVATVTERILAGVGEGKRAPESGKR